MSNPTLKLRLVQIFDTKIKICNNIVMNKFIIVFVILIFSSVAYASNINAAAVNTIKYNQNRARMSNRQQNPYKNVYTPQQARYYGLRVPPQNNQYSPYQNQRPNNRSQQPYRY